MKTLRFFFSPPPTPNDINDYISNFYHTLSKQVTVVNYNKKSISRSLDFLRYVFDCDVMILNWPEDVLHLRYGILQLFATFFSLIIFKIKGGTILWVCHNKDSHTKKYKWLRGLSQKFFIKIADHIVVHSTDAISYLSNVKEKVHFLNHPVYARNVNASNKQMRPDIDVLIWGTLKPYKGLSEFISNYKNFNAAFKVLMIGKANNSYYTQLKQQAHGLNIEIKNVLLSEEDLTGYFERSKIILLPYLDSDTFSSGALIHSLNSAKIVLGPAVGNFIDVSNVGACLIYKNTHELFKNIKELQGNSALYEKKQQQLVEGIERYYHSNSWDTFIHDFLCILSSTPKILTKPSLSG